MATSQNCTDIGANGGSVFLTGQSIYHKPSYLKNNTSYTTEYLIRSADVHTLQVSQGLALVLQETVLDGDNIQNKRPL